MVQQNLLYSLLGYVLLYLVTACVWRSLEVKVGSPLHWHPEAPEQAYLDMTLEARGSDYSLRRRGQGHCGGCRGTARQPLLGHVSGLTFAAVH